MHGFAHVAPEALQSSAPEEWAKNAVVNAYWWVTKTSEKKLVNVQESIHTIRNFDVPTLTNSVDLKPFTRLYVYTKPTSAAVPLSNAEVEDQSKPAAKGKASATFSARQGRSAGKAKAKAKAGEDVE